MGNGGWTNDAITSLTIPTGAQTGPRIIVGTDIPTVLTSWGAANNVSFTAAWLIYWNNTDFFFEATGTFANQNCVFTGTYDTTNSVYVQDRILDTGAAAIERRFGSYALNSFQELWTTQQIKMQIGDGSAINDAFSANCDISVLGSVIYKTNANTNETWHPVTLLNNFTNGTPALQVRRVASPPNSIQLEGFINSGATTASGTSVGQLSAGYRPAVNTIPLNVSNASANTTLWLGVQADGNLALHGTWSNGQAILISGVVPIDL